MPVRRFPEEEHSSGLTQNGLEQHAPPVRARGWQPRTENPRMLASRRLFEKLLVLHVEYCGLYMVLYYYTGYMA